VTGTGTPPIPSNAGAVVLNVTRSAVGGEPPDGIPAGILRPNASNLNFAAGTVTANLVTATLGQSGAVSIYNALGTVNVLADVEGISRRRRRAPLSVIPPDCAAAGVRHAELADADTVQRPRSGWSAAPRWW